jgi:hypothetical protein
VTWKPLLINKAALSVSVRDLTTNDVSNVALVTPVIVVVAWTVKTSSSGPKGVVGFIIREGTGVGEIVLTSKEVVARADVTDEDDEENICISLDELASKRR